MSSLEPSCQYDGLHKSQQGCVGRFEGSVRNRILTVRTPRVLKDLTGQRQHNVSDSEDQRVNTCLSIYVQFEPGERGKEVKAQGKRIEWSLTASVGKKHEKRREHMLNYRRER